MGLEDIPIPAKTVTVEVKPWTQSRALRIGFGLILGGGLDLLAKVLIEEGVFAGEGDIILMVCGTVMSIVRMITSQPVGKRAS